MKSEKWLNKIYHFSLIKLSIFSTTVQLDDKLLSANRTGSASLFLDTDFRRYTQIKNEFIYFSSLSQLTIFRMLSISDNQRLSVSNFNLDCYSKFF